MELLKDGRCDGGGGTVTKCILVRVLIFNNAELMVVPRSSQTYARSVVAAVCRITLLGNSKKLESFSYSCEWNHTMAITRTLSCP